MRKDIILFYKTQKMGIVDELESAIDMVDLVSKYTKLKKSGTNYKSVCPFPGHNEKTPSFMVSKSKQLGYCFGCHKGGGPVKFIMDIENCDFKEAIEILSNFTGIAVNSSFNKENFEKKKSLYSLYKDTVYYYQNALKHNTDVKKYLMDRGLTHETIEKYYFGYADSGIGLYNHLRNKNYNDSLIEESKIFVNLKTRKDKFIGRIIFPIQNQRGDFIALAGRIIGSGEPKYLNSPVTKVYDKSNILYGLYNARNSITKEDFVIISEGYMDTISLQSHGFFNTVGVCGTALTEKHITILKRLTHKIFLCFDGDKAGEKATIQTLEIMKNKELEVKIISLPKGKDPDEIIKSGKDFQDFIDTALSPIGYYLKKSNINLESIDEKKKALGETIDLIRSYTNSIERDYYLKEVSKLLEIEYRVVAEEFYKKSKTGTNKESENKNFEPKTIDSSEIAVGYMLSCEDEKENKKYRDILKSNISLISGDFENSFFYNIIWNINSLEEQNQSLQHMELHLREKYKGLSLKISEENKEKTSEAIENDVKKVADSINRSIYKRQKDILKEKMKMGDENAFIEYSKLIQFAKKSGLK